MQTFRSLYARYYDLMYSDKNYSKELRCVESWIKKYGKNENKKILSLGAGTLNYERLLAEKGFVINGVDLSPDMVKLARQKIKAENLRGINVNQGDMLSISERESKYDIALAMFNVIGYCRGIRELEKVLRGIARVLKPGGIFIFDAWYASAVRQSPPQNRWKKYKKDGFDLYRLTRSQLDKVNDRVKLEIELIELGEENSYRRETERHVVSYWDTRQLRKKLVECGFMVENSCAFPDINRPISVRDWAMAIVARKK